MVDMQGIVAETQLLGGPVGNLLGHVHERSWLQDHIGICLVTGDANVLAKLVAFSLNRTHQP